MEEHGINWVRTFLATAITGWLALFCADKIFTLPAMFIGCVGAFFLYATLFALVAFLAPTPESR